LGGARPLVLIQCTGLFEAGDALRNVIHDLKLPIPLLIGVRSAKAAAAGQSKDTCPIFTEPILDAWQLPYRWLPNEFTAADLEDALHLFVKGRRAGAVLIAE
jgi:sulfopyruvate decarboxylase TPP-binding subunit